MNSILSLIYREMIVRPRKRLFLWKRMGVVFLVWMILYGSMPNAYQIYDNPSLVGLQIFTSFTITMFIGILLIAPASAASVIAKEKQKQTLGLLLLTELDSMHIIVGKFCSEIFFLLLTWLSCLPLFLICVSFGGVSGEQIVVIFLILFSVLFLNTAWGIFTSTLGSPQSSQAAAFGLALIWLGFSSFLASLDFYSLEIASVGKVLSTPHCFDFAFQGTNLDMCFMHAGVNVLFAFVLLKIAAILLSNTEPETVKAPVHIRLVRFWQYRIRKKSTSSHSEITGNPVVWRDYFKTFGGENSARVKIYLIVLFFAILYLIFRWGGDSRAFTTSLAITGFTSAAVCFVAILFNSARCLVREKENNTLELLFCTGLSEKEIVWGKLYAIFKSVVPFLIVSLVCGLLGIIVVRELPPLEIVFGLYLCVGYALMVCGVALYVSLRTSTVRKAITYTIVTLIVWHIGNNMAFGIFLILIPLFGNFGIQLYTLIWGSLYLAAFLILVNLTVSQLRSHGLNSGQS